MRCSKLKLRLKQHTWRAHRLAPCMRVSGTCYCAQGAKRRRPPHLLHARNPQGLADDGSTLAGALSCSSGSGTISEDDGTPGAEGLSPGPTASAAAAGGGGSGVGPAPIGSATPRLHKWDNGGAHELLRALLGDGSSASARGITKVGGKVVYFLVPANMLRANSQDPCSSGVAPV